MSVEAISLVEAAKQALEALEPYSGVDQRACDAEDALRTAIEQAEKQEPVASHQGPNELWLQLHGDCSDDELEQPVDYTDDSVTWCWHQIHDSDVRYVRADLATPPAAPVQEPAERFAVLIDAIKYHQQTADKYFRLYQDVCETAQYRLKEIARLDGQLAAAQRQWVGLTDEEIHDIYDQLAKQEPYGVAVTRRNVGRAIEAKLREKNGRQA